MKPIVRCPTCNSALIQLVEAWILAGSRCVAARRCPACEHCDDVELDSMALRVWLAREDRLRGELTAVADALASEEPLLLDPSMPIG